MANRNASFILTEPNFPPDVLEIMDALIESGYEAYVIGGAPRDLLRLKTPKDYDIFTDASGEQIVNMCVKRDGWSTSVIGDEDRQAKLLTIIVNGIEVSSYRANGDRTEIGGTLESHCATADFTINAMAMDRSGQVFDFHNGVRDLGASGVIHFGCDPLDKVIIKAVGKAEDRIAEDPLRILRAVRFMAKYNAEMDTELKVAISKVKIMNVKTSRVGAELEKIFAYENGFEALWKTGILFMEEVIPEFTPQIDMSKEDGGKYHNETPMEHNNQVFKTAWRNTDNIEELMKAVLHDIGKGKALTYKEDGAHFYNHEHIGSMMIPEIMGKWNYFPKKMINRISICVRYHIFGLNSQPRKHKIIALFRELELNDIDIDDFIFLYYCDYQGNLKSPRMKYHDYLRSPEDTGKLFGPKLRKMYYEFKAEGIPFHTKDLNVNGNDLLIEGLSGPQVGKALEDILDAVISGAKPNDKVILREYIRKKAVKWLNE